MSCGILQRFDSPFQDGASFVDPFCYLRFTFVLVLLSCLFLADWERADLLALLCVKFSCVLSLSNMVSRVRCST